jgi:unsaturated rhamnogalacturonyl hydrolase
VHASNGVARPLAERTASAAYAAMAYWFYRWDWGESVALDGLSAAGHSLEDRGMLDFVARELNRWTATFDPAQAAPNPMGPAVVLLQHLVEHDDALERHDAGWSLLSALAQDIVAAGQAVGAIAPERDGKLLFVDSLYGVPEFLVRYADATDDPELAATAVDLVTGHCARLQRPDGLFAHFADLEDADAPAIPWGRGNGWAALGLSGCLQALGAERIPSELQQVFLRLLDGLAANQAADGAWRNLVDDPTSYPEASVTAMVSCAITGAFRAGLIERRYCEAGDRAWDAVANRIDSSGHLTGVSYRPGVNSDRARYEHTPTVGSYPWGQGPFLLAAVQRLGDAPHDLPSGVV